MRSVYITIFIFTVLGLSLIGYDKISNTKETEIIQQNKANVNSSQCLDFDLLDESMPITAEALRSFAQLKHFSCVTSMMLPMISDTQNYKEIYKQEKLKFCAQHPQYQVCSQTQK